MNKIRTKTVRNEYPFPVLSFCTSAAQIKPVESHLSWSTGIVMHLKMKQHNSFCSRFYIFIISIMYWKRLLCISNDSSFGKTLRCVYLSIIQSSGLNPFTQNKQYLGNSDGIQERVQGLQMEHRIEFQSVYKRWCQLQTRFKLCFLQHKSKTSGNATNFVDFNCTQTSRFHFHAFYSPSIPGSGNFSKAISSFNTA